MIMRRAAIAAIAVVAAHSAFAAEAPVESKIDAVTVYPDGATVTRTIRVDLARGDTTLVARDFPPTLDPASLRVEGDAAGRVVIGSIDARPPRAERPPTHPELEKQLEALRDERGVLDDTIAAATARKRFIERFASSVPLGLGEKADARPLTEWRAAFAAISEELIVVDASLRDARLKQRDLDRQIARVEADLKGNPARKMEVRIDLAAEGAGAATFRVSYTVRGARWTPLYDARLDSGGRDRKPALELVRRAEIVQQTGEDWTDVALAVSTVRTAKGGAAPELRSLIVRYLDPRAADRVSGPPPASAPAPRVMRGRAGGGAATEQMKEQEAEVDTSGFQALFRIPGRITIATNEGAKALRITSATVAPELLVRSAPALDDTAFLEASFKHVEDAPLLPGRVSIYRDGIYVGRGAMPATPKEETVRLGFGADEKVKVTRVEQRKTEGSSGIISSSKTDEREYKITVRNGHEQPLRIQVEDQLPVSEIDDVKVELLAASTQPTQRDVRDRKGVVAWAFDAKPGEVREIKFGWRVRWPADKTVVYTPRTP
jgi:uncharacterized protein (TIGR02231 family)